MVNYPSFLHISTLLKGNVINCVFEMKDEIKLFLGIQERKDLVIHFEDEHGIKGLSS